MQLRIVTAPHLVGEHSFTLPLEKKHNQQISLEPCLL